MEDQTLPELSYVYNYFSDFFAEAAFFACQAASQGVDKVVRPTFAKTAILYSVFSLEAAANSLVADLDTSGQTNDDFDKLTIIGKFQLFQLSRVGLSRFDRGSSLVQSIVDLIKLRNELVHAKLYRHDLETRPNGILHYPDIRYTKHLKLPLLPYFLEASHAKDAVVAVDQFLETFLLDWCQLSVGQSHTLLYHRQEFRDFPNYTISGPMISKSVNAFDELGLKMRYINRHMFGASFSIADKVQRDPK